jgi:6-phosphogluconolactonase
VSLKTGDAEPEKALGEIEARVRQMPMPFAAVILGLGEDGHTASFFPKGDRLHEALDPSGTRAVETMRAPGAAEPRVTLTFSLLKAADFLALHIEGESKRHVLSQAERDGPLKDMPVRAFLRAGRPLEVFWAA